MTWFRPLTSLQRNLRNPLGFCLLQMEFVLSTVLFGFFHPVQRRRFGSPCVCWRQNTGKLEVLFEEGRKLSSVTKVKDGTLTSCSGIVYDNFVSGFTVSSKSKSTVTGIKSVYRYGSMYPSTFYIRNRHDSGFQILHTFSHLHNTPFLIVKHSECILRINSLVLLLTGFPF